MESFKGLSIFQQNNGSTTEPANKATDNDQQTVTTTPAASQDPVQQLALQAANIDYNTVRFFFNVYQGKECTISLRKSLELGDDSIDLDPLFFQFLSDDMITDHDYYGKTYKCEVYFGERKKYPVTSGTAVDYTKTGYAGLFVSHNGPHQIGHMQCSDGYGVTEPVNDCILEQLQGSIKSYQGTTGQTVGVVFTYLSALCVIGCIARWSIPAAKEKHQQRQQAKKEQAVAKATENTHLLAPMIKGREAIEAKDIDVEAALGGEVDDVGCLGRFNPFRRNQ